MEHLSGVEDIKTANRKAVIRLLRSNPLISRTQVAVETGLSKATISRILNEMLAEGLVEEVRSTESGIGRPHVLLRLVSRTRCAVGVELTATVARITLADMNAKPLKQRIHPVYNQNSDEIIAILSNEIKRLIQDVPDEQVVGVGIAVPGMVNASSGVVNMEFPGGWREIPIASRLSEKLDLPVFATNQAYAAAWGEKWSETEDQVSDLLYIRMGSVVQAGMIIDGRLHAGKMLSAGAIGHMTLDPNGAVCECGNRGCLNTVASAQAVLSNARAHLKENSASMLMGMVEGNPALLTMAHLLEAAKAGDDLAVKMFNEAGRATGVVVAGILNLLNFERVVIGGLLSMAGNSLLLPLRAEIYERALPSSLVQCRIEITKLGANGASLGAASVLLQNQSYIT